MSLSYSDALTASFRTQSRSTCSRSSSTPHSLPNDDLICGECRIGDCGRRTAS
ncbi:hypothetical protein JYU34_021212 [Plutella xylostella]|uniref:Uncharacterized protein n=1 Tax=Plutella xylostella TaxID=51655 RepID=A0ABQ7PT29_PLUXY|nr:hypothetical protein JYU34_021212 [Plutella xylostella]